MSEESEEIDFSKLEILRGKTPEDIKQKCFDLCKDYLGGVWLKVGIDDVEVKRLSGGFTNQLYYCAINKQIESINDEPQEVAIRLYGEKHFNNLDCDGNERLTDVIIALLVSEYNLGPKIYGLFESGQIQKYYKHRQFRVDEQNDPKLVKLLATKLARVQSMSVPIKKTGDWMFGTFDSLYSMALKKIPYYDLIEECNCETLKKHDLKQEIQWLKSCIIKTNSPIVFCHNDFRGGNIMVTDVDNNNIDTNDNIILCDLEYSSYGFRGTDFGTIFTEWGRGLNDFMKLHDFPEDSIIKPFIDEYISESVNIFGKKYFDNKLNSFGQILKEIKVFTLVSNIFILLFIMKNDEPFGNMPFDVKKNMEFVEILYKNYFHLKQKFIDEKTIENVE